MQQEFLDLYANIATFRRDVVIPAMIKLERLIPDSGSCTDLADLSYVMREALSQVDEMRKELRKAQDLAAKMFTVMWANDPEQTGPSVKTPWCIAEANPQTRASAVSPSKDPEGYAEVMRFLGVPDDIIASQALRTDWDAFGEVLTQAQRAGKVLPEAIGKTYTEYKVNVRRRKELPAGSSSGSAPTKFVESNDDDGDDANF